ncbi:unnamed protein product [Linum tenue]|uniref:Cation/H+ exchanger domain-containing protein n=1 Tax=Linum tenue TaxID=586396 RepID=A0AAV0IMQ6_9ROSI|nr:unnamed protein product [Linum tenue]
MEFESTWKNETVCYTLPPLINAENFGDEISIVEDVFSASLSLLNIQIFLIYVISNSLNKILKRFSIPSFVSQLLTGIILGPTFLRKNDFVKNQLFPRHSHEALDVVGMIGYFTFMFLSAVKMDVAMVIRSGKKVMTIGLASTIIPFAVGLLFQRQQIAEADDKLTVNSIVGITSIQSLTTFPVVSQVLEELKLTNSEIGRLALSSSLVSGLLGALIDLVGKAFSMHLEVAKRLRNLLVASLSIAVAVFVFRPAMVWVVKRTPQGGSVKAAYVFVTLAVATSYVILFDELRLAFIVGAFIFGLIVPPGPPFGSSLVETLETVPQALFFPVFVATTAMKADLTTVFGPFDNRGFFTALIYWSAIEKFIACLLLALPWMPLLDSVVLSLVLNSKGVVEASIHAYQRDTQMMGLQLYSLFLLSILVNATVIPVLVSILYEPSRRYAGYHSRNIFALRPVSELRVLACVHKPHHVASTMKLLDTLCRTEESAVALYVIHLLEQIGHATPIFITHQKQKKSESSDSSYSHDVVVAFDQYERNNMGCTSAQIFTSISHAKFMQEDVFTLALDKLTSIILVPFHRKWGIDGRIESEDNVLRALNYRILDTAPCSVGILYDRGSRKATAAIEVVPLDSETAPSESASCSICAIYLGGRDDREAISLAKRMANDPSVHLTILHLVSQQKLAAAAAGGEAVLDDEVVLNGVLREMSNFLNVQCLERVVRDGTETASLIAAVADQYDVFVVGRRWHVEVESPQTAGLADWSEFPELGVIGDLLASKDVRTRGSVLVVQQQRQRK